jgi:hypothetical protein
VIDGYATLALTSFSYAVQAKAHGIFEIEETKGQNNDPEFALIKSGVNAVITCKCSSGAKIVNCGLLPDYQGFLQ